MNIYKRIFSVVVVGGLSLLTAAPVLAAGNSVAFTADTNINISSLNGNLIITSGSAVSSYSVSTSTLSLTLDVGSNVTVKSNSLWTLANSNSTTTLCSGTSYSYLTFAPSSLTTIVITPTATNACPSFIGGGVGVAGGGGGGSPSPAATSTPSTSTSTPATTISPPPTPQGLLFPVSNIPNAIIGTHPDGSLVLDGKTIYLIQNNQRMAFRDPAEYQSFGFRFNQAVTANDADRAMPLGQVLKAFDGTLALDTSDNKTIYMVAAGTKRGFVSLQVFKALGYKTSQALKINLSDYPVGNPIISSNDPHPNGALVKSKGGIYWIGFGKISLFPSAAVFNSFGFNSKNVVKANNADLALPTNAPIIFRDGTLVKDSPSGSYYIISDGQKRPFASKAALLNWGYKLSNVVKADISSYPLGNPL